MEEKEKALKEIQFLKMQTKSQLEQYRFLEEAIEKSYKKEINELLDRLNFLNEMENKLNEK